MSGSCDKTQSKMSGKRPLAGLKTGWHRVQAALRKIACLLEHARTLFHAYIGQGIKELHIHRHTLVKGNQVESEKDVTLSFEVCHQNFNI